MEENTQLPKEVENKIIDEAYDKYNLPRETLQREAYQVGATAYATKLHQANETIKVLTYESNRLKGQVEGLTSAVDELKGQSGARWVKASEPNIKDGHYVAKYKPDDVQFAYDPVGMAFVDGEFIQFICPSLYDIKWCRGHEELRYLQILDESAVPQWTSADTKPEHNVGVLVFIPGEDNHITSGMWDVSNEWVLLDEYRTPEEEVTHWMPLPSFPEGYSWNEIPADWVNTFKQIAKEELGKLTQSRADLIREANNRDLGGTAGRDDVEGLLQYISEGEFYYNHEENRWMIKGTHSIKLIHRELIDKYELFKQKMGE